MSTIVYFNMILCFKMLLLMPVLHGCPSQSDTSLTPSYLKFACWQQVMNRTSVVGCKYSNLLINRVVCDIDDEEDYREFVCKGRTHCIKRFQQKVCTSLLLILINTSDSVYIKYTI